MPSPIFSGDCAAPLPRRALFLALCAACAPVPVLAATTVWDGSSIIGLWTSGPWIDARPQSGDDALLLATGGFPGSQTVLYDETGAPALASLTIDGTAGISMTLDQSANTLHTATLAVGASGVGSYVLSGGTLTVTGTGSVGAAGLGTFTQSNADGDSTHTTGTLVLGAAAGASGSYSLTDTGSGFALSLDVAGDTIVAGDGDGAFSQSGGTVTTDALYVGGGPNPPYGNVAASASYALNIGSLTANATNVGNNGSGVFLQFGGTFHAGALLLGNAGGTGGNSYGQFFLSGTGTLVSSQATIGAFGRGEFTQSGGTHTVGADLVLGDGPAIGGTPVRGGVYTLSGGDLGVAGSTLLGNGNDGFTGEPGGDGTFTQTGGTHTVGADLIVGDTGAIAGGTGSYTLGGTGVLAVSAALRIGAGGSGFGGSGSFTQTAGSASAAQLALGSGDTGGPGTGSYALAGGTLDIAGQSFIGDGGSGTFTQTGGAYATDYLDVGIVANSTGTFTIRGGTATARVNLVVGSDATTTASVVQTGGSVFVQSPDFGLYVNGSYTLSDADGPASLAVTHDAVIGDTDDGSFVQSQGAVTVGHELILGSGTTAGADGSYAIAGGTLVVAGRVIIGQTTGVAGTFTQTGGTVAVGGDFVVANLTGGDGTATLNAGSLTVHGTTGDSRIVVGGLGTGTFTLAGGSASADGLSVGNNPGGSGTFAQSGGTLTITGSGGLGRSVIGALGSGAYVQTGGTHATTDLVLGNNPGGGGGSYSLGNAVLTVGDTTWVGALAGGTFVQTDGTHTAARLRIGSGAGATGTYALGGGTVSVGTLAIVGDAGSGTFFQSGGSYAAAGDLMLGRDGSGVGSQTLADGSVAIGGDLLIGNYGQGSFTQTAGSVAVAGELLLGGWENVAGLTGSWSSGHGLYTLDDGTLDVTTDAVVGNRGNGRFVQTGGTFTVANALIVGNRDGTVGAFEQGGGTTRVDGELIVGRRAGASGSYRLAAGILDVSGDAYVAQAGTGTFTQTGGIARVGNLLIGAEAGSTGKYALDNGTLVVVGTIVLGGTATADGGRGELALSGTANLYANGLDLRPGGRLSGLGGGITLGDSEQGNAGSGTILVNRGGTLAGNGTIPGSVTVGDGGTVSPGNSIGTLTVADAFFGSGSTLRVEIDGAGNADRLHASGTVTIDGGTLRIDSVDGTYSTEASYTVLTADGGVSGTFPNVVTSLPLLAQTATYTASAITLLVPTPDQNASRSGVDLIGGSPASLLGRMTLGDVEAGFLLDPLLAGIEAGQAGIGLRVGRYYADGYRQTYEELPLRYAWKLDNGLTVLGELPIATITTTGRGINRQDRSYGLGGGLRIPMAAGWELKPMLRYGTVVDDNFDHIGSLASATLTSHFRTGFGKGYEFGADNLIGYFKSVGGKVAGLDAGYRLHEVALHNAVRVGGPLEGSFLGNGARWTAWISDTRYLGSDLASDHFQRLGFAATTRVTAGGRYSENLSLGLNYTQSAGGDHGVELNFGYRF